MERYGLNKSARSIEKEKDWEFSSEGKREAKYVRYCGHFF